MPAKHDNYLDTVFNTLNEAVFVYDQNMEIKYFNAAAEKITGHLGKEVLGKKCTTLFDKSLCLNNCDLCMTVRDAKNDKVIFNSPFVRKDGVRRLGDFRSHPPQAGIAGDAFVPSHGREKSANERGVRDHPECGSLRLYGFY